jgi:hypothetical protein
MHVNNDDGRFKPGQSGNPNGRPKGALDKRLKVRRLLEAHSEEMTNIVLDMARERDPVALKLIFERISPRPKSESVKLDVDFKKITNNEDLMKIVEQLLKSAVSGDLPDDQGRTVSSLIKTASDLYRITELEERLTALENK